MSEFPTAAAEPSPTAPGLRVGQGWDVHALVPGRRLRIGGVDVAHRAGALGHSDADVLLHAITDALLGAAALGDIGSHFPDTDPRWRGADSSLLLREVAARVRAAGWQVANVDSTVIAQAPRLAPFVARMAANVASAIGIDAGRVSVKAKTGERLGFVGRAEGIAAQAIVLLVAAPVVDAAARAGVHGSERA
ncbi:MAG: 2-C-methyl-D-erythritol 2,4-cyclodiphosphate synthase [Burkholderiaceae bacterium]|nr:2-C-methyl-D-erythritol 2,4-cyclodiphosphate synthase [Burkholderiaceae bacterium]